MNIRTRLGRLEETARPQAPQHICLVTCAGGRDPEAAEAEVKAAYVARHGREPDGFVHIVPMGAA